jgi:secondary thiamine-phosphate synthase enzyme
MILYEELNVNTNRREILIDITNQISDLVLKSKIKEGVCRVFVPHTTAGITINENADPSVKQDIITFLKHLIPQNAGFSHMEGNSDSHIKSSLMGVSLNILIHKNNLTLGTWQGIMFAEFDGPRNRKVCVQISGE